MSGILAFFYYVVRNIRCIKYATVIGLFNTIYALVRPTHRRTNLH